MTIKNKLTIGITLLTLISTVIASVSLGWLASQSSTEALQTEANKHLIAARETSKSRIEQYFEQIRNYAKETIGGSHEMQGLAENLKSVVNLFVV